MISGKIVMNAIHCLRFARFESDGFTAIGKDLGEIITTIFTAKQTLRGSSKDNVVVVRGESNFPCRNILRHKIRLTNDLPGLSAICRAVQIIFGADDHGLIIARLDAHSAHTSHDELLGHILPVFSSINCLVQSTTLRSAIQHERILRTTVVAVHIAMTEARLHGRTFAVDMMDGTFIVPNVELRSTD